MDVLLWTKAHVPHRLVCLCLICVAVAVAGGIWEVIRSWGSVLVTRFMSLKVKHAKARFLPPSALRTREKMAIYKGEEEKMGAHQIRIWWLFDPGLTHLLPSFEK